MKCSPVRIGDSILDVQLGPKRACVESLGQNDYNSGKMNRLEVVFDILYLLKIIIQISEMI